MCVRVCVNISVCASVCVFVCVLVVLCYTRLFSYWGNYIDVGLFDVRGCQKKLVLHRFVSKL